MDAARAFSPGHVTGFFSIHPHENPLRHGSTGAGFSLSEGTTTVIRRAAADQVSINGISLDAPVSRSVLRLFRERTQTSGRWQVLHETSLPVGCGFGTSGSGALSLALALNEAEGSPLEHFEAASLAHLAELEIGTGLGTVLGEAHGGFEVRTLPGAPGTGTVAHLPFSPSLRAAFVVFGPLATPKLLGDGAVRRSISREGESLRQHLLDDPGVDTFLRLSLSFGRQAGLVSPRLSALQDGLKAEGICAPMLMFGDGLFTLVESHTFESVLDRFRHHAADARVFGCGLDSQGGRTLVSH